MSFGCIDKNHRYFVRVRGMKRNFIEFDFAIDTPDLSIELLMPQNDFDEFCRRYDVTMMSDAQIETVDHENAAWRINKTE